MLPEPTIHSTGSISPDKAEADKRTGGADEVKPSKLALALAAPVALAMLLAGCASQSPTFFRPEGTGSGDVRRLAFTIFAILAGVLLTVWGLLAVAVIRNRKRPESEVKQTKGNLGIEIVWTAIPAIIIVVLFGLTQHTTSQLAFHPGEVQMTVTGHQWWWEFQYAGADFKTANEAHVPVGKTVSADLLSADVIHSFWVPQISGKVDMIPGHTNRISFLPLAEGTYLGECSEFCGQGHAHMRFVLVVESQAKYDAWFADQQRLAAAPAGPQAQAGAKLVAALSCGSCHTIRGTSLAGTLCPDLTHFGSRGSIGADTLPNTAQNLSAWITNPQAVKPGVIMPAFALPPQQLDELVAYLEGLK